MTGEVTQFFVIPSTELVENRGHVWLPKDL
jgi:hypothetical protein